MLNRRQAIIWTNVDLIHWRIYTALVGDELTQNSQVKQYNLPLGWTYFAYIATCIPGFTFFIVLKCSLFISNVQWHLTEGNELSFSLLFVAAFPPLPPTTTIPTTSQAATTTTLISTTASHQPLPPDGNGNTGPQRPSSTDWPPEPPPPGRQQISNTLPQPSNLPIGKSATGNKLHFDNF